MDYYQVPTYLDRLRAVMKVVQPGKTLLNVGCGRGAFNPALRDRFDALYGIDVNEEDISAARALCVGDKFTYEVMDAAHMTYKSNSFDTVICIDVLEHVQDMEAVLTEIYRVLRPGGQFVMTAPNEDFPWTYDPINRILSFFHIHLPIGAYAFGHTRLINRADLLERMGRIGFKIHAVTTLSHHFTGFVEMYHIGFWQFLFKPNSKNTTVAKRSVFSYDYRELRPLRAFSEAVMAVDTALFSHRKAGIVHFVQASK